MKRIQRKILKIKSLEVDEDDFNALDDLMSPSTEIQRNNDILMRPASLAILGTWEGMHVEVAQKDDPSYSDRRIVFMHLEIFTDDDTRWKSLFKLDALKTLVLRCNTLKVLGEEITKLRSLECLVLHKCYKLTSIPDSIGTTLSNLCTLDLSDCPRLKKLPSTIGQLSHLVKLQINLATLEEIPDSIGDLAANLKYLEARGEYQYIDDDDDPTEFGFFRGKQLNVNTTTTISKLINLEVLVMNVYNFISLSNEFFSNCTKLNRLELIWDVNTHGLCLPMSTTPPIPSVKNLSVSISECYTSVIDIVFGKRWLSFLPGLENLTLIGKFEDIMNTENFRPKRFILSMNDIGSCLKHIETIELIGCVLCTHSLPSHRLPSHRLPSHRLPAPENILNVQTNFDSLRAMHLDCCRGSMNLNSMNMPKLEIFSLEEEGDHDGDELKFTNNTTTYIDNKRYFPLRQLQQYKNLRKIAYSKFWSGSNNSDGMHVRFEEISSFSHLAEVFFGDANIEFPKSYDIISSWSMKGIVFDNCVGLYKDENTLYLSKTYFPSLEYFQYSGRELNNNRLEKLCSEFLPRCPRMTDLHLNECQITDIPPRIIRYFPPNLKIVDLTSNPIFYNEEGRKCLFALLRRCNTLGFIGHVDNDNGDEEEDDDNGGNDAIENNNDDDAHGDDGNDVGGNAVELANEEEDAGNADNEENNDDNNGQNVNDTTFVSELIEMGYIMSINRARWYVLAGQKIPPKWWSTILTRSTKFFMPYNSDHYDDFFGPGVIDNNDALYCILRERGMDGIFSNQFHRSPKEKKRRRRKRERERDYQKNVSKKK